MSRSFYNSSNNSNNNQQREKKSFHTTIILKIKKFINDTVCVCVSFGENFVYLSYKLTLFCFFQFTDHMD